MYQELLKRQQMPVIMKLDLFTVRIYRKYSPTDKNDQQPVLH
jgi:hypothetical protein